jgi:RNA polymerase-binding transcription factor
VAADAPSPDSFDLAEVERELRRRRAEISAEIGELTSPPEGGSAGMQFGKRVGEGTTEAISRFANVGVANDLQAISDRIDRALSKLEDGSYGSCDRCGRPIAVGRLRAAPESTLCIECARRSR